MKTMKLLNLSLAARVAGLVSTCLLLAALSTSSARADIVYVTGCVSNCVSTTVCGNGPNLDYDPNTGVLVYNDNAFGAYTSAKAGGSGVADKPITPGSRYFGFGFTNTTPDVANCIVVAPTLGVPGAVYRIDHTYSSTAGNCSSNVILGITNFAGCTLSTTNTDKFQSRFGNAPNSWSTIGYLTNDPGSSTPMLGFYYVSGTVDAGLQQRLEVDTFKFIKLDPCLQVAAPAVTGPIAAGLTNVTVTGIVTNATKVTAYQDSGSGMVSIGSLTISTSPAPARVTVPVSGLVVGARAGATQTVDGQESCVPTSGALVGQGANTSLRVALSIRCKPDLPGPVGVAAPSPGANIFFLGASAILSGACPDDAMVIYPSNAWQTITLQRGPDPLTPTNPFVPWNGTLTSLDGNFGALEGIAFACEGNPGNFDIYIDDLSNGTNGVFENYETNAVGSTIGFSQPGFSGTTAANLLASPNSSVITTDTAFTGSKCTRVQWQFVDGATNRWLRLVHSGNPGVANPMVDLNEPISFKLLLLRPGDPVPPAPVPFQPGNISLRREGSNVILSWAGSYPLQSSGTVTGGWSDVGVSTGPFTNAIGTGTVFYRLRSN